VHGDITFAGGCVENNGEHSIFHLPDKDEPDNVHWFGFDCAHAYDYSPGMGRGIGLPSQMRSELFVKNSWDIYRNMSYVKAEVEKLALQLHAVVQ
jgi:hypothetical protein